MNGEGGYIDILPEPAQWTVGGAEPGAPKILDDVLIRLD